MERMSKLKINDISENRLSVMVFTFSICTSIYIHIYRQFIQYLMVHDLSNQCV